MIQPAAPRARLERLGARLDSSLDASMAAKKGEYLRLAAKLDALSPLKVLARGYSIAMDGAGRAVKDAGELNKGDRLTLRLHSGSVGCRVEDIYG